MRPPKKAVLGFKEQNMYSYLYVVTYIILIFFACVIGTSERVASSMYQ